MPRGRKLGHLVSEETRKKIGAIASVALKGKMPKNFNRELQERAWAVTRNRISPKKGKPSGYRMSDEERLKVSSELKRQYASGERQVQHNFRGEKNPRWKGGVSKTPGYSNFISHRRRSRLAGNGGFHTFAEWQTLKAQYNWTCPCCHKPEPEIKLTEDHVIPITKGGSDNIENIQPLCRSCNSKKQTKVVSYKPLGIIEW